MVKNVKTSVFFTTYEDDVAEGILNYLRSNYEVIEVHRSRVIGELYYVSMRGKHPEVSRALEGRVLWLKVDVVEVD